MSNETLQHHGNEQVTTQGGRAVEKRARRTVVPRTDIYETEEALILFSDLPGVRQEDVDITLEKDVLILEGKVSDKAPEGYTLAYAEYAPRDYRRVFTLNAEVQRDKIEASLKDGVLKLVLPKIETAVARKISVRAG